MSKKITTILWDWNGTLLNDRQLCINSMNQLLTKRNLPVLTVAKYMNVFTFPVKDYYKQLGFSFEKEPFEIPAEEFIVHYNEGLQEVPLFDDVVVILDFFLQKGIDQYIISAMEHNALLDSVEKRGILRYFRRVSGIDNNLAHGKTDIAVRLIEDEKIDITRSVFIGDTLHDAEVSEILKVSNILISRGHQHESRLKKSGNPVLDSLDDLKSLFADI